MLRIHTRLATFASTACLLASAIVLLLNHVTFAQQAATKTSDLQLYELSIKLHDESKDFNSVMDSLHQPLNPDDSSTWLTADQGFFTVVMLRDNLRDASTLVRMYKTMNLGEQNQVKQNVLAEIAVHQANVDYAYNCINHALNLKGISAHPGLVDDLTTAKSDARQGQELLKSDTLLTN